MVHKDCGGKICIDVSKLYLIQSASIIINTKGVTPGMLEIVSSSNRNHPSLVCRKCGKSFSDDDDFEELEETCPICEDTKSISEILVSDFISKICISCKDSANRIRKTTRSSVTNNILSLYGATISKVELPTLLSVLTEHEIILTKKGDA